MTTIIPPVAKPDHVPDHLVFDFDIFGDDRFREDVQHSYVEALRDAPDLFWTPRNGGHWMARRYDDISAIVREPAIFSAREMQVPRVPNPYILIPLNMDPPQSTPFRMALMPRFSPKAVAAMEPRIRAIAIEILDQVAGMGACDFIDSVASLFPVSVFMDMMGMDRAGLRACRDRADAFFKARTQAEFEASGGAIMRVLEALIADKRARPGDDLVSFLLAARIEGRPLTQDEMLRTCFLLFLGGMDTVTNVTGFTFAELAKMPALQARLAADPGIIPKFVEEGLRCFGVSSSPRLVTEDAERFGISFKAGEMVVCLLPISGRDDRANADPMAFDVDRDKQPHLTFSSGPHLCIGHILARAEMCILTEEWVRRIPAFAMRPGARRHFRTGTVLAIETLPIEWPVDAAVTA